MSMSQGASSVYQNAKGVIFQDGTVQTTAAVAAVAPLVGVAVLTGTTSPIVFASPYTSAAQPVVLLTPYTQAPSYWVTFQGTAGNWTGFTVNVASSYFGAFNYAVFSS